MDQKKTGRFLKELRMEKGLTQEQLSEILGVSNRSISRWENGVNMPDFDLVIELANYYQVSIEELLDGERSEDMIDKKTQETLLKVADYNTNEKIVFSRRLNLLFILGVIAFIIYMILNIRGLTSAGIYENIADLALGLVLGTLLVGVLYTSRYITKIKAFKQRLLGRIPADGDSRS